MIGSGIANHPRRRHFTRNPDFKPEGSRAGRLAVTRRDLDMIATVARYRFIDTAQMCRLFACNCPRIARQGVRNGAAALISVKEHTPGCACTCGVSGRSLEHGIGCKALFKDDKHVASRLRELYQAGFLDRPVAQLQLRVRNGRIEQGSVPMVYSVTPAGIELIGAERRDELGAGKLSWTSKVNEGGKLFIEHTLAVADASIAVDLAVRNSGNPDLVRLSEAHLLETMTEERQAWVRPWSLSVRFKEHDLTALCDLAFAIGDRTTRKRWNFLVEVDRGHMPVERTGLAKTSILRKLIAYAQAYEDRLHKDELGWKAFRVIILTTSKERVRSCAKAARKRFGTHSVGRLFVFGVLDPAKDMLSQELTDIEGKPVQLLG